MAKFSFRKRTAEDEGLPEEEGSEVGAQEEEDSGKAGRIRLLLIVAGIGVILIGGWYMARPLFFAPPPPPPPASPVRPVPPPPSVPSTTVPAAPTKEAVPAPAAPTMPPTKEEAKPAPVGPPVKAAGPAGPAKEATPGKAGAVAPQAPGKAEARSVAQPEKPAPASYSLQMGAMVMEENAAALKRKLDAGGFPSVIRKGTAYVTKQIVTAGEPTGKREADELSRRLNVDGFPSQLMADGGKYTPEIGAFFNLDEAIDLARELQKKNYSPKIISRPATTVVYQVRHGKFDTRAAAVRRGEELKRKGFNFLVVRE